MSRQQTPAADRAPAGVDPGRGLVSEFVGLWAQGVPADARDFLARHPEVNADKSLVLDLAYEEYCCRKEAGELPDADEFCARYPSFRASLQRIIRAHRFLEEGSSPPDQSGEVRWPRPGDTLLGFTLRQELGRGSFARVFLAEELAVGQRLVAVKIALQGAAEAQTLGRLRHEHIVEVYSVQEDPATGLSAVCMPFAGSATLCDVLDRTLAGPGLPTHARVILEAARDGLPAATPVDDREPPHRRLRTGTYVDGIVHLGARLAEALDFTHARGVLHRDLKPSNVLLTPAGKPMLLDFNLAFDTRATEERLGGTLPYMAPEHLRATDPALGFDPSLVTTRSDLFSLGVILYELLAGAPPFGKIPASLSLAEARAHLLQRQQTGPAPLRRANPQVDAALARLIESCLAFDQADRPQSAATLAAGLRRSLSRWRRGRRWVVRHCQAVLAAAVLIVLAGSAAGYLQSQRDPPHYRLLRAGLEAYHQGNYLEAADHFRQATKAAPRNPWLRFALGRALQQQAMVQWVQRADDSEALFREALEEGFKPAADLTPDGRVQLCMGVCHSLLSDHVQAVREYQRALEAGFVCAEVYNNLGYSHSILNTTTTLEKARDYLDQAIALNPHLAAAYRNRAWVRFHQSLAPVRTGRPAPGVIEALVADIEQAVELSPPCPETSELYTDATFFLARAATAGHGCVEQALAYGRLAIAQGQGPKLVNSRLHQYLPDVEGFPPNREARPSLTTLRVVDPLRDLPTDSLFGR